MRAVAPVVFYDAVPMYAPPELRHTVRSAGHAVGQRQIERQPEPLLLGEESRYIDIDREADIRIGKAIEIFKMRAAGETIHVYRFIIHAASLSYAEAFKYPVRHILADAAAGELAYGGHRFLRLSQDNVGCAAIVHGGKGGIHALKRP